jgi:copper resistance protein B
MALGMLALFVAVAAVSLLALRSLLYAQLDGTLLHIAEVEARHGAASTGSEFTFHEGVLLQPREGSSTPLTRYAQLWTSNGRPLVRSRNLHRDLNLPHDALVEARRGEVGWATHVWGGEQIRSVVFPLELVGAAHGVHVLQVAAPTASVRRTLTQFGMLLLTLSLVASGGAFVVGWRLAGVALRPTREITEQAEVIRAGTLSERITAHADVQEFSRLVTVLNGMLERLEGTFEGQRRFIADASHELRAPLTVLRGEIDVALRRERSAAEYREMIERCREEVLRMSVLVQDLLALARSDAGVLVEQRVELDLCDLARRVTERHRPLAADRGVRLAVRGTAAPVTGDPTVLEHQSGAGPNEFRWDVEGWYGGDFNRVWLKSEGVLDAAFENEYDIDVQLLYGRFLWRYYDLQLGARLETQTFRDENVSRVHAVVGLEGLVPYGFDVEAALFLSDDADVSARLSAEKDFLVTQRLIFQPRVEAEAAVQEVERFTTGSGLNSVELGLRLRYEVWRKFGPYVGASFDWAVFETADLVRAAGEDPSQARFVVGLRAWY